MSEVKLQVCNTCKGITECGLCHGCILRDGRNLQADLKKAEAVIEKIKEYCEKQLPLGRNTVAFDKRTDILEKIIGL